MFFLLQLLLRKLSLAEAQLKQINHAFQKVITCSMVFLSKEEFGCDSPAAAVILLQLQRSAAADWGAGGGGQVLPLSWDPSMLTLYPPHRERGQGLNRDRLSSSGVTLTRVFRITATIGHVVFVLFFNM